MTVIDAINEVDNLKPNMYEVEEKIKWLSRLDVRIFEEVLATHILSDAEKARFLPENPEPAPEQDDTAYWALDLQRRYPRLQLERLVFNGYGPGDTGETLLVGEPYDELYSCWLAGQIDWHNMEYDSFNANNARFESLYSDFRNAFNRTHKPIGINKLYY